MADVSKLINHPERDKIMGKLVMGESPRDVAQYLKLKFHEKDEQHLRLSAKFLKDLVDNFDEHFTSLKQQIKNEHSGKLSTKLAESLMNNKAWRERMDEEIEKEIDLKKRIQQMIHAIEARAEQVFDKIQENPGMMKGDYVLIKYFDLLINALEKADKIINERPDKLIQADITINMVEQQSFVMQEAIRMLLLELDPEISARFMEILQKLPKRMNVAGLDEQIDQVNKLIPAEFDEAGDPSGF